LAAGEEMMWVADSLDIPERVPRCQRGLRTPIVVLRRSGKHCVDRGSHEFDVPELFRGDVGDEVVERSRSLPVAKIERLERVVQKRRHLAEFPAHQLLHARRTNWIRLGWWRQLHRDPVVTKNHLTPPLMSTERGRLPSLAAPKLNARVHELS
jgi:hypothetical protein